MVLERLDHAAVRTANLETMVRFYREVLGLVPGPRPPFPFKGCWLYCGEQATVHLIEVPEQPETQAPRIEHFAFAGRGLGAFLQRLRDFGVAYSIAVLPEWEIRQVNFHDPDGNHLHCDFRASEQADLSPFTPD